MRDGESRGQPASPESLARVAKVADTLFFQCPFEEKIEEILQIPPEISARRLAQMPGSEGAEILAHLPAELVEGIVKRDNR